MPIPADAAISGQVDVQPEPVTGPAGRALLDEYEQELQARWHGGVLEVPLAGPPSSAADLVPPSGVLLVARVDGTPAGCVGLRTFSPGVGEIKRMFVLPGFRGRGLGRRLLAAVEEAAREMGHRQLRLDTMAELTEARGLYASAAYHDIPPYTSEPFVRHWLQKEL